jgi:hypothetical protein
VKNKLPITADRLPIEKPVARYFIFAGNRKPSLCDVTGFSLVELMVVITLLSLIVLVLMAVFNSTQTAFRAGVTQSGVLEDSRAAMDMMTADLKLMTPSDASTNLTGFVNTYYLGVGNAVNFFATTNLLYQPLPQTLPGSGGMRTNVLQSFFLLSKQNLNGHSSWIGTGYAVMTNGSATLYPLYRFTTNAPSSTDPIVMFNNFEGVINGTDFNGITNAGWSHLIDGVVDLRVHAYNLDGYLITNSVQYHYEGVQWMTNYNFNAYYQPSLNGGEPNFYFYSNAIPAAVEVQMGVLEDRAQQRAASRGIPGQIPDPVLNAAQWQYLQGQAGRVHLFRQRVTIPNVDPTAYQ